MNKLRIQAEKLRESGYSYNMIKEKLGVSPSTQSYWFKDKPFTPNREVIERIKFGPIENGRRRHNERVKQINELREVGIKEIGRLNKRDLWMLGLGLYIGEGAKTTEMLRISNSDPSVIRISILWLKEICNLTNDNLSIRLHLYPDNDLSDSIKYWSNVTKLPLANFRKTHIDKRTNKINSRRGKLPYGTAHISVICKGDPSKGVKLYRRINGWMTGSLQEVDRI